MRLSTPSLHGRSLSSVWRQQQQQQYSSISHTVSAAPPRRRDPLHRMQPADGRRPRRRLAPTQATRCCTPIITARSVILAATLAIARQGLQWRLRRHSLVPDARCLQGTSRGGARARRYALLNRHTPYLCDTSYVIRRRRWQGRPSAASHRCRAMGRSQHHPAPPCSAHPRQRSPSSPSWARARQGRYVFRVCVCVARKMLSARARLT